MTRTLALAFLAALVTAVPVHAGLHTDGKHRSVPSIEALRGGSRNTASNIEFWQTNYGELFLDISVSGGKAGTFWPRGTGFSYIFGGGFWFGAVKGGIRHVLVGYNPYNGGSWFQPGSIEGALAFYDSTRNADSLRQGNGKPGHGRYPNESDNNYGTKYTIYYSTNYDKTTGRPLKAGLPPWPIWDTDPDDAHLVGVDHYFGNYVDDVTKRDTSVYPIRYLTRVVGTDTLVYQKGGPAFISEEDMFTVCNDLDTTYFVQKSNGRQYPLKAEVQRTIYSWGSEVNKNYIFIAYKIFNKSNTVLDSCWLAPVLDADIGVASNDENSYYNADTTLNLALQWSDKEANVPTSNATKAYPGVLGIDFLESPAVYKKGEVPDSLVGTIKPGVHANSEQLGLVTFDRWQINKDPTTDDDRYAYMTGRNRDVAPTPPEYSDKRLLMATGPFRLLPGQAAQVVVGLLIARDSAQGDDNIDANKAAAVKLDDRAQTVYDSNFRVPQPPSEPAFTKIVPLSNGTFLKWDSLAEFSYDPIGTGLDFKGYRLYRGRHDQIGDNNSTMYDQWKNPLGYKLVKEWKLTDLDSLTFQELRNNLPDDKSPADVRSAYYAQINHYMDSLTNHHSYYDFGDDNHDGQVTEDETLINDVDYYYWIVAFDEGDPANGIVSQPTTGKIGQSKIRVHPVSSYAGDNSTYKILDPQGSLGGISTFEWQVQNQEVINQLLAQDTLTVAFTPHPFNYPNAYGVYGLDMRVRDDAKSIDVTYPYWYYREFPVIYSHSYQSGQVYVINDSTTIRPLPFGQAQDTMRGIQVAGLLRSVDTSFAPNQYLLNAISHSMNYNFYEMTWRLPFRDTVKNTIYFQWCPQQYQLDTVGEGMKVVQGNDTVAMYWDNSGFLPFDSLADMGQYDYYVEFSQGGVEQHQLKDGVTYDVPYLNVNVRGEQIYTVKTGAGTDSTVRIVYNLQPQDVVADPDLKAGNWAMEPVIWKLTPSQNGDGTQRSRQYVPSSQFGRTTAANKYYLSTQGPAPNDTNRLVFVNRLSVGGNKLYFDYPFKRVSSTFKRDSFPGWHIGPPAGGRDMQAGDVVRVRYVGGMVGLPTPGASFKTVFTPTVPQDDSSHVTAGQLDRVNVWPNPYIIGNSIDPNAPGLQKPAYEDRLVFNHLPPRCTIRIFNVAGELIRTINHASGSEEYYNMLSDGRQRVGSQLLVAQVETPFGETKTLRIAAIVYGR